jgi:Arc/MetJ family transcription regulator
LCKLSHNERRRPIATNLDLDDKLIAQTVKLGKFKTKRDAVNAALREYVQRHSQASIIELMGTIDYDERYDYKKARRRRHLK